MNHRELDRAIDKARQLRDQRLQEQQAAQQAQKSYFAAIPEATHKLRQFLDSEEGRKIIRYLALTGKTIHVAEGKITTVWPFSSYANTEIRYYVSGTGLMESRPRYDRPPKTSLGNPKMCCLLRAEQGSDPMAVPHEIMQQLDNLIG